MSEDDQWPREGFDDPYEGAPSPPTRIRRGPSYLTSRKRGSLFSRVLREWFSKEFWTQKIGKKQLWWNTDHDLKNWRKDEFVPYKTDRVDARANPVQNAVAKGGFIPGTAPDREFDPNRLLFISNLIWVLLFATFALILILFLQHPIHAWMERIWIVNSWFSDPIH